LFAKIPANCSVFCNSHFARTRALIAAGTAKLCKWSE
jgi:hypothetical protein